MSKRYTLQDIPALQDSRKVSDVTFRTVINGIVLPLKFTADGPDHGSGGVLSADLSYVPASGLQEGYLRYGKAYEIPSEAVKYSEDEVIWFGLFVKHWGHFLMELVGRMWYLLENYQHQKIVYISRDNHFFDGVFTEFMTYLDVPPERIVRISEPKQFSKVIVPDYAATEAFYSDQYRAIFKKVVERSGYRSVDFKWKKRIYFSRKHFFYSKFKDFGETAIERAFSRSGYQSVVPEQLSLREQICIWNEADQIATINGTIPLNILFSFSHPELVVLNKTDLVHTNLLHVQKICNYVITYVDIYHPSFAKLSKNLGEGPFFMYPSQHLRRFFTDSALPAPSSFAPTVQAAFQAGKFYCMKAAIFLIRKLKLKRFFIK